ncbi:MAG: CPBP family intramembrane metalloprotease [Candidatus Thorarchaeota archaeon]|nr:CPBP family intramembrane metalloprotease [Candidatus Thorarchaeota archaeon]
MTTTTEHDLPVHTETKRRLSSIGLLTLTCIILLMSAMWRVVDVFVLQLGNTWMNILPSKLGPLTVILTVVWVYRRNEIESVLGLSKKHLRPLVLSGLLVGFSVFFLVIVGSTVAYGLFVNPEYSLSLSVVYPSLLLYSFFFFFVNAVFEETLFRGMLQNSLRQKMAVRRAILLSAIVFGFWHACWPMANGAPPTEWVSMILLSGLLGAMFGVYYERFSLRTSLVGNIVAHTLINFLNEGFKVGSEGSVQGPDFSFNDPVLMGMMAMAFIVVFSFYLVLFSKRTVVDMERALLQLRATLVRESQSQRA